MTSLRALTALSLASLALAMAATPANAHPSVYPTGTTIYDPAKAWNGYVVFAEPTGTTHLIDMDGHEVHSWDKVGFPSEILDPAVTGGAKGHLLVQLDNQPGPFGGIFSNRVIGELDWNGKEVWRWEGGKDASGAATPARQNHDWARLPNGNTLIVATVDRVIPALSDKAVDDQVIEEITPADKIVWQWYVGDHVADFGIAGEGLEQLKKLLAKGSHGHGFLTINDLAPVGPNKWYDAGDQRFHPDNLVVDSRNAGFIAIIDRHSGKVALHWGPDWPNKASSAFPWLYALPSPRPLDQTSGQHDAHIIPKGLPGAGNLLVFDNEGTSGWPANRQSVLAGSRVLEIDPTNGTIVWQYDALASGAAPWTFFSSFISSARRLPNGNTLIDEGMNGRLFQVTPGGEIVWEYVNPYYGKQQLGAGPQVSTNWVFRAQPVPYDWAPAGTPHEERAITPPDNASFHVGVH